MSPISAELKSQAIATKGFMPEVEGDALYEAACLACRQNPGKPIVEVGTYCGRSTIWLATAAKKNKTYVFTVDHHFGSEENQQGWEWFDESLIDPKTQKLNTLPTLIQTLNRTKISRSVVPIVAESQTASRQWSSELAFCFIDGGHGEVPARMDYSGGQSPFEFIYSAALKSKEFVETSATGSLRVLRKVKKS
jgi:hypothetical protein